MYIVRTLTENCSSSRLLPHDNTGTYMKPIRLSSTLFSFKVKRSSYTRSVIHIRFADKYQFIITRNHRTPQRDNLLQRRSKSCRLTDFWFTTDRLVFAVTCTGVRTVRMYLYPRSPWVATVAKFEGRGDEPSEGVRRDFYKSCSSH